jgi:hypothetical protein
LGGRTDGYDDGAPCPQGHRKNEPRGVSANLRAVLEGDDREYAKEYPLIGGYVFFLTEGDDYAGIPDIHGVYRRFDGRQSRASQKFGIAASGGLSPKFQSDGA